MRRMKIFGTITIVTLISIFCYAFMPRSAAQVKGTRMPETVFSNTTPITINTASGLTEPTVATAYPSNITVSGMTGTITRVAVTLNGATHPQFHQLDFLLVSPTGAKYIFLSDAGPTLSNEDRIYTFSDDAPGTFPSNADPVSGNYRPTSGDASTDTFPAPAPVGPYNQPNTNTFASTFNGSNPNGTWSFYAVDDTLNNAGSINTGWALTITTDGAPATFTNSSYIGLWDVTTPTAPYGTTINVAGVSGAISSLKVILNGFSHTRPQDVDILLVSPNGKGMLVMSDAGSTTAVTNSTLTFDDAAASALITAVTGTYRVTDNTGSEILDAFPPMAPIRPYNSTGQLSNFNGFSPNGDWQLYVLDDDLTQAGSISGGWSLDITTTPVTPPTPPSCSAPAFLRTNFDVGTNPGHVAVADFNNDTFQDLAVTNQFSNNVSILLGTGNGSFGPQTTFPAGANPYALVAAKFNADNNFDLAVVNSNSGNVSILLGNGNGTFSAATNFPVGTSPISIASADFNNDAKQDLAVANFGGFFSGTISILLGNGTGGFTAGNTVVTRTQPTWVAVLNFNGDANPDIAVTSFNATSVSTFTGGGNGTFLLLQNLLTSSGPVAIEAADFLGNDGFTDLAIADYNSDAYSACQGNSNGVFSNCSNTSAGTNPVAITSGDYVGSGSRSLAIALSGANALRVIGSLVAVGQNPNSVRTADFNGDTKPDLVTANSGSNNVSVLINSCKAAKGNLFDFAGDRRSDFALFRPGNQNWYNYSVNQSQPVKVFARPTDKLVPADYNGDRKTDYAFYRPEAGLWHIIDDFSRPLYFLQFGIAEDIPVPADYDFDGKADIAVFRPSQGTWYLRRSSDNGLQVINFGTSGDKPVPADYDGDGKDDIAVFRPSTGTWYILRSSDGQVTGTQFGISEDKVVPGDYDADGKDDIAVFRPSTSVWYVLKSSNGAFQFAAWGTTGDVPVVGDYDGDGSFDFGVWRPSDKNWYVLKSSDGGSTVISWGSSGDIPLPSVLVR